MLRQWSGARSVRLLLWPVTLICLSITSCFPPALEQADSKTDQLDSDNIELPAEAACDSDCASLSGPCSRGECVAGQCVAAPLGQDTMCEDERGQCWIGRCQGLVCVVSPKNCSDGLDCSDDACNLTTGECVHDRSACVCENDSNCDNGDPCDGQERCRSDGTCVSGEAIVCERGLDPCNPVACDKRDGVCRADTADNGTSCDDGDPCSLADRCTAGSCDGTQKSCEPSGPCESFGVCDSLTGLCQPTPRSEGAACETISHLGFCVADQCIPRRVLAGGSHTCVMDGDQLGCWGNGFLGQLGIGSIVKVGDDEHPLAFGLLRFTPGLSSVSLGLNHTCSVLADSRLRCWGEGANYQHGYGHNSDVGQTQSAPQLGNLAIPLVSSVAAGSDHTCALMEGSKLPRCWGRNTHGQLGRAATVTIGGANEAIDVSFPSRFARLYAGPNTTCGIDEQARLWCWGQNTLGKLGLGHTRNIGDDEAPSTAGYVPLDGGVVEVGIGSAHVCVLLDDGRIRCWGGGPFLGLARNDALGDDEAVLSVDSVQLGGRAIGVSVGSFHTCALLEDGAVRCWGLNDFGQLGLGHTNGIGQSDLPVASNPVSLGGAALQVSSGSVHSCALLANGDIKCWGRGGDGRLGLANEENIGDDETPDSQPAVRWR